MNLSWKLAQAICGGNPAILESYEQERRTHTAAMADMSVKMGYVFLTRKQWAANLRDSFFRLIQRVPAIREFVQTMQFKPKPVYGEGFFYTGKQHKGQAQGTYFPQPERLDEYLGKGFAVLALNTDPAALVQNQALWRQLNATFITVGRDIKDTDGKLWAWFNQYQADVVIIRPDRFVYAAGSQTNFAAFETALAAACLLPDAR